MWQVDILLCCKHPRSQRKEAPGLLPGCMLKKNFTVEREVVPASRCLLAGVWGRGTKKKKIAQAKVCYSTEYASTIGRQSMTLAGYVVTRSVHASSRTRCS